MREKEFADTPMNKASRELTPQTKGGSEALERDENPLPEPTDKESNARLDARFLDQSRGSGAPVRRTLGRLDALNDEVASKVKQSTGTEVGDLKVELRPELTEKGKRAVAEQGVGIGVVSEDVLQDSRTMAHEAIHGVQQRGGSGKDEGQSAPEDAPKGTKAGAEPAVLDAEAEAVKGAQAVLGGQPFAVRAPGGPVLYEELSEPVVEASEAAKDEATAGAGAAQAEMLKSLESDAEKYEKKLEALAKEQEAQSRLARQDLDPMWEMTKLLMLDGLDLSDAEILKKTLTTLEEAQASIRAERVKEPRVQLFERFTALRRELESAFESSSAARRTIKGDDSAAPTVKGEDLGPAVEQAWAEITAGFQSAFDQAAKLPEEPREECRAALLAKYDAMSEKLWQLYSQERAVEVDPEPKPDPSKGVKAELEAIKAESRGMYKGWLEAKMSENVAKANARVVAEGLASGAAGAHAFDNAPYQSVAEVKAAQKKWLNQLEVAWESDKPTILNWVTGNQDKDVQTALYRMGKQNAAKSGARPDAGEGEVYSYKESRQSVQAAQKARDSDGKLALNSVESLLLSGALEAKRHFERMMAANPKPDGEKKLEIMGEESVYRNFDKQVTKWTAKFTDTGDTSERQKTILSVNGVAAPGFSRHGYGAEYDLGKGTTGEDRDLYEKQFDWLEQEAWRWGFFRPFKGKGKLPEDFKQLYGNELVAVIEEFWHWSYYPVSQALWELISEHSKDVYFDDDGLKVGVQPQFEALYEEHRPLDAGEVKQQKEDEKAKKESKVRKVSTPPLKSEMVSWVRKNVQMIHNGINREVGPEPKK